MSRQNGRFVCIVTARDGDTERVVGAVATFATAYRVAKRTQQISKPNVSERTARENMKRTGSAVIFDTDAFEYVEAAEFLPHGRMAKIQRIPIISK